MKKSIVNSGSAPARIFSMRDIFCVLCVITCSLTGFAQVVKYFHGLEVVLFAIGIAAFVTLAMLCLRWIHLRSGNQLGLVWLVLPWCLFTLLFVVLFPLAHRHTLGPGSDRDDALRVAASALLRGHFPYRTLTYLENVITPLPGAILLAVPFFLLGNVSLQNIFWLAMFIGFACWFFRSRSTAVVYVLVLLGASAANLDDFVVGGDYLVNAMYVCVALAVVLITHKAQTPLWRQIAAEILLGLAVDSRPVYVVVLPVLLAYLWQRGGRAIAIRSVLISASVAALLTIPFYLHDPANFTPFHIQEDIEFIPEKYHALWLLPALGLLASCAGFFIRLSRQRVYVLIGVSLFCMIGPPAIAEWFLDPFTLAGWYGLSVLSLPALFFSLWLFAKYEETGHELRLRKQQSPTGVSALF